MSTISSGVGLISGIDYQSLIDKLITADSKPRQLILTRMSNLDAQRTAYLDISARLNAVLSRIQTLSRSSSFQATKSTSSLPDLLSVTTSATAQPGTYQFAVRALAATHQLVSRGFADATTALPAGTLTIESAQARVDRDTRLDELNGHTGVQRGSFKITNAAGQNATINVADALTLGEVLDKINAAGLNVTASVQGDGLVLTDRSGGTAGSLRIQEVDGGRVAADLGFGAGHVYDSDGDGAIGGTAVMYLSGTTALSALNDGLGVRRSLAGGDFTIQVGGRPAIAVDLGDAIKGDTRLERLNHGQGVRLGHVKVTSKDGTIADVDLSAARNVSDVQTALQGAFGNGRITVSLNGSRLVISDNTTVPTGTTAHNFVIEDVTGGYTARDLGIDGNVTSGTINGRDVLHVDTLTDVLNAINYAAGNEDASHSIPRLVTASIDASGHGLVLTDVSGTGGSLVLATSTSTTSHALTDLGFTAGTYEDPGGGATVSGVRIMGGLDTVLLKTLNGGNGLVGGTIRIAAGTGTADVDLSSAQTLSDVVRLINQAAGSAGLTIEAAYDSTGTRLSIANLDGGSAAITISDVTGDFAATTGLAQTTNGTARSDNLQRQYVSENTLLADLSDGRGISFGSFKITNSQSASATISISSSAKTLQDVINSINASGLSVTASINDTGDGLLLTDSSGGSGPLKVEENGGSTAHSLNLLGESATHAIDGSFEYKLTVTGNETVTSLATRISNETTLASASVLNDGTGVAPYRLNVTSRASGQIGELILDDNGSGLGFSTLSRAQDARMLFGGNGETGVVLTSSTNTFSGILPGVSLTANGVTTTPATVTVAQDIDALVATMNDLVSAFNDAMDKMKAAASYDEESEKRGVLLGESTLRTAQARLFRSFARIMQNSGSSFQNLTQVGLKVSSSTGLTFDEDKFRAAYDADPAAVTNFFTNETNGIAPAIQKDLEALADSDGLIQARTKVLADQKDTLQKRADELNDILDRKRARLTAQFQAMEAALSELQSQSATLSNMSTLLTSSSSSS